VKKEGSKDGHQHIWTALPCLDRCSAWVITDDMWSALACALCVDKITVTDPCMALALLSDSSQRAHHSQLDISRSLTSIHN